MLVVFVCMVEVENSKLHCKSETSRLKGDLYATQVGLESIETFQVANV
jgi:hypothetical protein